MSQIHLQSVGKVPAVPASELKAGDVRMYNFGSTGLIVKVIEKTPKTLQYIIFEGGKYWMSDIRKDTLVAIVKHDQDVSEHKPTEAYNTSRNKGMIDVSEYFKDEAVAIEVEEVQVNENNDTDNNKELNNVKHKLMSITVSTDDVMGFFVTFADASKHIEKLVSDTYDHCRVSIQWEDLREYKLEYDLGQDPFKYNLSKRVKCYIENVAALEKANFMYGDQVEAMQNLLNNYQLEDEPETTPNHEPITEATEAPAQENTEEDNTNKYILNRETNKIELHFSKAEYQALSDSDKSDLKRAYLFSGSRQAWVSRSSNNHYSAIRAAEKLGFNNGGKTGERLSYAEEMERKAEKAETRAERYEKYSDNAEKRAEGLQAGWNEARQDWSFVTQPNINSSRGRAFTNQRNKLIDRYEKGFQEYRKSEYFKERAETAQRTADNSKLNSKPYLDNRIEECKKEIRQLERRIVQAEEMNKEEWLSDLLERMEYEMDKQAYFENCLDDVGGVQYNKDNLKPGYLVKIRGSWELVVKANPKTVEAKSAIVPYALKYTYAEIQDMRIPEGWTEPKQAVIENPFNIGDIVGLTRSWNNDFYRAFQVIKTTDKSVTIQRIDIQDGKPVRDAFVSDDQQRRSVKEVRGSYVVNYDDQYLYRYNQEESAVEAI